MSAQRLAMLFAILLLAAALPARAQTTGKIGVVDIDAVIARSKTVAEAVRKAEQTLDERRVQIEGRLAEIQKARSELDRQRSVMSAEQVQAEEEKIRRQREELDDLQYQTNKELSRIREEVMPPEVDRIIDAVKIVAQEDGYALILPSDSVLFHIDSVDITALVVQKLDRAGAAEAKPRPATPAPQSKAPARDRDR